MTFKQDIQDVKKWWALNRRDPVTLAVVLGPMAVAIPTILVIMIAYLYPSASLPLILSRELSAQFDTFEIEEAKVPCRSGDLYLIGYKFAAIRSNAEPQEAIACWNIHDKRWVWSFRNYNFAQFDRN